MTPETIADSGWHYRQSANPRRGWHARYRVIVYAAPLPGNELRAESLRIDPTPGQEAAHPVRPSLLESEAIYAVHKYLAGQPHAVAWFKLMDSSD